MSTPQQTIPVVMTFAGLDPSGGAGIQADIEAIGSMGCHTLPVVTSVVPQDTHDVKGCMPLPTTRIIEQARVALADIRVSAFKVGLLGSAEIVEAVRSILSDYPDVPVIVDPVATSGAGTPLSDDEILDAMVSMLFPQTTVLTPNSHEARALAPEADTLDAMAQQLMSYGCEFVLLTGTHENTAGVVNTLYTSLRRIEAFTWERLPEVYHGSGCTLAAAIAGLMAQGREPYSAIHGAQEYTWETLRHAYRIGGGQHIPNRLYWAHSREE